MAADLQVCQNFLDSVTAASADLEICLSTTNSLNNARADLEVCRHGTGRNSDNFFHSADV